jgi:hypothetical protein
MMIVSILIGAVWGALGCAVNFFLLKAAVKKSNANAVLGSSMTRMLVDAAALGAVFLARQFLPIDFAPAIIATAVVLSLGGIVSALLLMKKH